MKAIFLRLYTLNSLQIITEDMVKMFNNLRQNSAPILFRQNK